MRTESNHRRPRRYCRLDFVQRVKTGHVMNVKHAGWPSNVKCDNLDSEKQVSRHDTWTEGKGDSSSTETSWAPRF